MLVLVAPMVELQLVGAGRAPTIALLVAPGWVDLPPPVIENPSCVP